MKVSKLIKLLEKELQTHGDLPVNHYNLGDIPVTEVSAYDKNGGSDGEIVEIYLH